MRLGYARVSRAGQHTEQPETALDAAGCDKIFIDHKVSGAVKHRPQLSRFLDNLRPGDVVVTKIGRLGRDLQQMLELVASINACDADIVSLAEPEIDTTSAEGKLVFAALQSSPNLNETGWVSALEKSLNARKQMELN